MRLNLYRKQDCIIVVGGVIFEHLLVGGLCVFFVHRFLIETYDPGVFVLLAMFVGMTIWCNILLARIQGLSRCLIRCSVDTEGIHCSKIGLKKWCIPWDCIRTFGTTGFGENYNFGLVFLSRLQHPRRSNKELIRISNDQIVFQFDPVSWDEMYKYMPADIYSKLTKAVKEKRNSYYSRRASI